MELGLTLCAALTHTACDDCFADLDASFGHPGILLFDLFSGIQKCERESVTFEPYVNHMRVADLHVSRVSASLPKRNRVCAEHRGLSSPFLRVWCLDSYYQHCCTLVKLLLFFLHLKTP